MHSADFEPAHTQQSIYVRDIDLPDRACVLIRKTIQTPFDLTDLAPQCCQHIPMRALTRMRNEVGLSCCGSLKHCDLRFLFSLCSSSLLHTRQPASNGARGSCSLRDISCAENGLWWEYSLRRLTIDAVTAKPRLSLQLNEA